MYDSSNAIEIYFSVTWNPKWVFLIGRWLFRHLPSVAPSSSTSGCQSYWVCWYRVRGQNKSIRASSLEGVPGPGLGVAGVIVDHILFAGAQLHGCAYLLRSLANGVYLCVQDQGGVALANIYVSATSLLLYMGEGVLQWILNQETQFWLMMK